MTGIERLRRYASDMRDSGWKSMHDDLSDIADLIECEQDKVAQVDWESVREVATDMAGMVFMSVTIDGLLRDWSRKLTDAADGHERAKDVSMSAYDLLPPEARDAIAWVREHGGLEAVKRRWECLSFYADPVPRSYAERRIASRQRQIDESHAALRRRNERIVELEHERDELREMVRTLNALTDEMEKRLMPEGMSWPVCDDGEPVRIGDEVEARTGGMFTVGEITFTDESVRLNASWYDYGETVPRPAPKVLDADGAEIELGDDLYSVEGNLKFHVSHVDRINGKIATDAMFSLDKWADPSLFTHRAPVLAADGKPLREGETVWGVTRGVEMTVDKVTSEAVYLHDAKGLDYEIMPRNLTHECPESWERLEEDAGKNPFDYCKDVGHRLDTCENSEAYKARDIVRRAKALAGDE